MSETPAQELVRRGKILAGRVEPECTGNGSYNREYRIGRISVNIDGWWGVGSKDLAGKTDWNKNYDSGLSFDLGDVEILDVRYNNDEDEDGVEQIQVMVDPSVIVRILGVVRNHMVLEDMADV